MKVNLLNNTTLPNQMNAEKQPKQTVSNKANLNAISNNANTALTSMGKALAFGCKTSIIQEDKQAIIPNLFEANSTCLEKAAFKNPPFVVDVDNKKYEKKVDVYVNALKEPVMGLDFNKNASKLPQAQFKVGKFDSTVELIDTEIGIKVKMLGGSKINGKNFNLTMPGDVKTDMKETKNIAFTGHGELQVVTYSNELSTKKAVDKYQKGEFHNKIEMGDFIDKVEKDDPTFMVLAGGFGTRLYDYTGAKVNKPGAQLPTDKNYRMMANAVDQASKSGILTGEDDKITYLSGMGQLEGDNVKNVIQNRNLGDGGCIAKAIAQGNTPSDKPLVILNADTITNADITRAYNEFRKHPEALMLIPYYAAEEKRAKDFGLMATTPVDEKVSDINSFVEKPKTLEAAEPAKVEGTHTYMANPGIYILSPKAVQMLGEKGQDIIDKNGYELGLAKDFITPLVEKCQAGEIKDENGNEMKVMTAPLEAKGGKAAYWDDLGRTSAIVKATRDMAAQTEKHGADSEENKFYGLPKFLLNHAQENVDLDTGIMFMDKEARTKLDQFKEKYGIEELEGNVIIFPNAA